MTAPPADATPYGVYEAAYLPNALVEHRVVTEDGGVIDVEVRPGKPQRGSTSAASASARRPTRGLGPDLAGAARLDRRRSQR